MAYLFKTDTSLPVHVPVFEPVDGLELSQQFFQVLRTGETIDPRPLPKIEQLRSEQNSVPDVFQGPAITYLSEPVKKLIEKLEPDLHQFVELKLLDNRGQPFGRRYFRFHIRQWADAMVIDKSTLAWKKVPRSNRYKWCPTEAPGEEQFTVSKPLTSGKHFWKDRKMNHSKSFCSDEFHEKFNAGGFKLLLFQRVDEY